MKKRFVLAATVALSALAVSGAAQAAWPDRPITIIVPFPAGGGTDTFARPLANQLGPQLKQSVVVANRDGAGGTRGAGVADRASAAGLTRSAERRAGEERVRSFYARGSTAS